MNEALKEAGQLFAARDYAAAESVCRAIIAIDPHQFDALHLLGVLLIRQDKHDEALIYLHRAEIEAPDNAQLRVNLGNALLATKQFNAAIAVSLCGDSTTLNNLGLAYKGLEQYEAAADAFRQATKSRWDNAPAWFNLATSLTKLGHLHEALAAARTALRVAPLDTPEERLADVISEIGRLLTELGQPEAALAECEGFLRRYPNQQTVLWNMSLCLLMLGRFEEGWPAYEHRFGIAGHDPRPEGAIVLDPAKVCGQRVLILTEQGRGDMLQFVRYAPQLVELGASVYVQAYPDLVALLAAMPSLLTVISTDDPRPEADLVTSVMSLPLAFGTHPATVPYLRAPPDRGLDLGKRAHPRIGVAWSGSPHSYTRSAMPAETLAQLVALSGFEFHCLQKDIIDSDQSWLRAAQPPIALHTDQLTDFADTAALIDQMDIVITIDTAVAHLAGALAKPVYILLPFSPDWRWMQRRPDSPWYPTARLFRQTERGAWAPVIQAVIRTLAMG